MDEEASRIKRLPLMVIGTLRSCSTTLLVQKKASLFQMKKEALSPRLERKRTLLYFSSIREVEGPLHFSRTGEREAAKQAVMARASERASRALACRNTLAVECCVNEPQGSKQASHE